MNVGMSMDGLRADQAPPLAIPLSFFVTAALAIVSAGVVLTISGGSALSSRYIPATMALTHLATLGFVGSVMLGALYQMIPVVAGAPVPAIRIAHLVNVIWIGGLAALIWGFVSGRPAVFQTAVGALGLAATAFIVPAGIALVRAPTRSDTVTGIRLSVLAFVVVVSIGLLLGLGRSGMSTVSAWLPWLYTHLGLGFVCWIGGLITAVSWQVIPMFYLAPEIPRWARRLTLALLALSGLGALLGALLVTDARSVPLALAPAAVAIWIIHPLAAWRAISQRRRKRRDASLRFWALGLTCGLFVCPVALATVISGDPRGPVILGWITLWGWAGSIVQGMLGRIVPFLIWFHRYAPLVGRTAVPAMRQLLPDKRVRLASGLHMSTLVAGCGAAVTGIDVLARLTGALLIATGAWLGFCIWAALTWRQRS